MNPQVSHRQHLRRSHKMHKGTRCKSTEDILAEALKLEKDTKEIKSFLHSPTLREQKEHNEK